MQLHPLWVHGHNYSSGTLSHSNDVIGACIYSNDVNVALWVHGHNYSSGTCTLSHSNDVISACI